MRNIDDWFGNKSHQDDLNARYDRETDDMRDPSVPGEASEHDQVPWPRRAEFGMGRDSFAGRRSGAKDSQTPEDKRKVAIQNWLMANPDRKFLRCVRSLTKAGYEGINRAMVSEVAQEMLGTSTAAPKPSAVPRQADNTSRRTARRSAEHWPYVPSQANPHEIVTITRRYCDSCGMAINDRGDCRCH